VGGDLAQHGVDELGAAVAQHHAGQFHAGADRRVGGDAGAQQLVRAQRQHVEHRRVDLAQRPVHAGRQHRVVGALAAQRAVHQLGGQRGVPVVEVPGGARLAQQRGQHEVGVGVAFVDGAQRLEGEETHRVLAGTAVGPGGTTGGPIAHGDDDSDCCW
jgi:hypothetical protein